MKFLKKNWSNVLIISIIILILIPQTGTPIRVFVQRLIAFSPTETEISERKQILEYDWKLQNFEKETVNFEVSKGKVAVVNFWATWCPPCIAEMPSFQKLYNEFGDRVDFYFVTQEEKELVENFLNKKNYNVPVYFQLFEAPQNLQSEALPTTYVISKKGEIVIEKTGVADWNSKKMDEILNRLLAE